MHRPRLGVNIDHIATLRQARGTRYPEPLLGAQLAQLGGADQITVHLREDRRHIQDRDVRLLREVVTCPLNLEMGLTDEMIAIALEVGPDTVTLVPERREERTTRAASTSGRAPQQSPILPQRAPRGASNFRSSSRPQRSRSNSPSRSAPPSSSFTPVSSRRPGRDSRPPKLTVCATAPSSPKASA